MRIHPTFVKLCIKSYCCNLKFCSGVDLLTPLYPIPIASIRPGITGSLSIACEVVTPNTKTLLVIHADRGFRKFSVEKDENVQYRHYSTGAPHAERGSDGERGHRVLVLDPVPLHHHASSNKKTCHRRAATNLRTITD